MVWPVAWLVGKKEGRERERRRGRQGKEEMSEMSMRQGLGLGLCCGLLIMKDSSYFREQCPPWAVPRAILSSNRGFRFEHAS